MFTITKQSHHSVLAVFLVTTALTTGASFTFTQAAYAQSGFTIMVDGERVAGDARPNIEPRKTDVDLAHTDIQVTFDGLELAQRLAVSIVSSTSNNQSTNISFGLETNYAAWISRSEIRVFGTDTITPIAVLPVNGAGADFAVETSKIDGLRYVARVYDKDGRYDETRLSDIVLKLGDNSGVELSKPFYGQDETAFRNIPVYGGTITVNGVDVPDGAQVRVLGEVVPVDRSGRFVIERILPSGEHVVDVALAHPQGKSVVFKRDVNIPTSEWYYVGLADVTVGTRWGDGKIVDARPNEFDNVYSKGQASFYLKGKVRGEYLITASANTGEGPLSELFSGIISTDPKAILRRIDPNDYYPVYGDDSVMIEDAPTNGKIYVRIERGDSHVLWGNFRTEVGESSMLNRQRSLYGASGRYVSDDVTANGDAKYNGTVYFAKPGTLAATDVLRGTGGSAYVLRRQDVAPGSEIVRIDTVNAITGMVTSTRRLTAGVDYSVNYLQGLVILSQPLASSAQNSGAVQSSQADYANLIVQYEYKPTGFDPEEYAVGVSGSAWLNDNVRIGGVVMNETDTSGNDTSVVGVNARIEASAKTFVEGEVLRSSGEGRSDWVSTDGGFTYVQQPSAGNIGDAMAYRVKAQADISGMFSDTFNAVGGIKLEQREAGFTNFGQQTLHDTFSASAFMDMELTPELDLDVKVDHTENTAGAQRTEAGAELIYKLTDDLTVATGVLHRVTQTVAGGPDKNGSRTDIGARVSYDVREDLTVHTFGQVTAQATPGYQRNDRIGLGADWKINEEWTFGVEGSEGTTGLSALALLSHQKAANERTYLGLQVAPDARDDFYTQSRSINGLVAGAERRLNEAVTVNAENNYGLFSDQGRLNSLYGIQFKPDTGWTASATYETGRIEDTNLSDIERHALSSALSYSDEGIDWTTRGEVRLESSADGTRNRNTYLGKTALSVKTNDDWRVLAGLSGLISRSDQSSILNGDYVEATIGGAYRPIDNDRWNALIRYTYLYDLPGPDQVSHNGSVLEPAQRSHIFSIDANYDITERITVGGKYGFRIGEYSDSRNVQDFVRSSAHLAVLRADFEIATDWHLLLEARGLFQPETSIWNTGALGMLSYDINDTVRIGAGYNFGNFSDDLRDLRHDQQGLFFNLAAKF